MTKMQNCSGDYVRFALETVDDFVAGNGQVPTLDFVMSHLRHTSLILGHKRQDRTRSSPRWRPRSRPVSVCSPPARGTGRPSRDREQARAEVWRKLRSRGP